MACNDNEQLSSHICDSHNDNIFNENDETFIFDAMIMVMIMNTP